MSWFARSARHAASTVAVVRSSSRTNSTRKRRTPAFTSPGTARAAHCAWALNTVLRHAQSTTTGCSRPSRSLSATWCRSHGRPQVRKSRPWLNVCA